jgi:hypothetical protein
LYKRVNKFLFVSTISDTMKVSCVHIFFQNELTLGPLVPFDFLLTKKSCYFALDWFFNRISCGNNRLTSAMSSRLSMIAESRTFFLKYWLCVLPNHRGVFEQIEFYCSTLRLGTDQQLGARKQT